MGLQLAAGADCEMLDRCLDDACSALSNSFDVVGGFFWTDFCDFSEMCVDDTGCSFFFGIEKCFNEWLTCILSVAYVFIYTSPGSIYNRSQCSRPHEVDTTHVKLQGNVDEHGNNQKECWASQPFTSDGPPNQIDTRLTILLTEVKERDVRRGQREPVGSTFCSVLFC